MQFGTFLFHRSNALLGLASIVLLVAVCIARFVLLVLHATFSFGIIGSRSLITVALIISLLVLVF
jgi:hypothetical protein